MTLNLKALWTLGFALMAMGTLVVYGAVTLTESTSVSLYKGTSKVRDYPNWATCTEAAKAAGQAITAGTVTYSCKTEVRKVVATYTADPPPIPVDCVVSAWSAWTPSGDWSACTDGSQARNETRSRIVVTPAANGGAACPGLAELRLTVQSCGETPPPPPPIGSAVVFYTDLAFAPPGALVTVWGRGLDAAVTGAEVFSQSATKTVLKWTGGPAMIGGAPVSVTTRAGTVREATPSTLSFACSAAKPGDVILLRAGIYTQRCGTTTWGAQQFNLGAKFTDVSFVGYPGEVVQLKELRTDDGTGGQSNGLVVANVKMAGTYCVNGGSWWEAEESGAKNVRVVNIDCHGNYGSANTMTGLVGFGGDGWKVLGNRFTNNAPAPINNNHAVYATVGADDAEVAWNLFSNMKMGHVIQQHTDGPLRQYDRLSIHDNELVGANSGDIRGINISGCTASSTSDIYNNVLLNLGQDFSGINTYCGQVKVRHNTLAKIAAPPLLVQGGTVMAQNNVFIGRANVGSFTGSNNVTSGTVDSTGRMVGAPKAPNVGVNVDHAGVPRGATVSVGAYE